MPIEIVAGAGTRGNPTDGDPATSALAPITALSVEGGRVLFAQSGAIFEVADGTLHRRFAGELFATSILLRGGELLVVEPEARRVRAIDLATGKASLVASARAGIKVGWKQPWSVAELGGALYVADEEGAVYRIDRAAKTAAKVAAIALARRIVARDGGLLVATGAEGIVRVDPATGEVTPFIAVGSDREREVIQPSMMTLGPDGAVWIADADTVRRYDEAAQRFTVCLGTGRYPTSFDAACTDPAQLAIPTPDCIAVDASGALYACLFSRILRVTR